MTARQTNIDNDKQKNDSDDVYHHLNQQPDGHTDRLTNGETD